MLQHDPIARDLRDDARRGDAEAQRVATDEGGLLDRKWAHGEAINEHMLRLRSELRDGAAHRLVRRAEDVQPIDLVALDDRVRPADVAARRDFRENRIAPALGELLRVVQQIVPESRRQNHRRRDDRPRERAAPGLIHARHKKQTSRTKKFLMREAAGHRGIGGTAD